MLLSHWLGAMMVITVLRGSRHHPSHPVPYPPHSLYVWTPDRPLGTVLPLLLFLLFLISSPSPSFHHLVSSCSCFNGAPSAFVPGIGVFGYSSGDISQLVPFTFLLSWDHPSHPLCP